MNLFSFMVGESMDQEHQKSGNIEENFKTFFSANHLRAKLFTEIVKSSRKFQLFLASYFKL